MGMLEIASYKSKWKGYDYFEQKKVKNIKKISENEFEALVVGSQDYLVHIDTKHPRKSKCNCPHANGRRIICKHMIALLFNIDKEACDNYKRELEMEYEEEEEFERMQDAYIEQKRSEYVKLINSMSENELKDRLLEELMSRVYDEVSDERGMWQYFIEDYD